MSKDKLFVVALVALVFNFIVISFVSQRNRKVIFKVQQQKEQISDQFLSLTKHYDSTYQRYRRYYATVYSAYRPYKKDTTQLKIEISDWASYYHQYQAGQNISLDFELNNCKRRLVIEDLKVWFITKDKVLNDYIINDSTVVIGNCIYKNNCSGINKIDSYEFRSYFLNHEMITYYPDVEDNSRTYIHAYAREYLDNDMKFCKVFFIEHMSNKLIGSIEIRGNSIY